MTPSLELALAFHQAVLEDHDAVSATITRLRELTQDGDHAYYIDFACFMADLPLPQSTPPPMARRRTGHSWLRSRVCTVFGVTPDHGCST